MKIEIVGYSGHSYTVLDSAIKLNLKCVGYYDNYFKEYNPYNLDYLGHEENKKSEHPVFISIGSNSIRMQIHKNLKAETISLIDPTAIISDLAKISRELVYVGRGVIVNPNSKIHCGAIINTRSVIEHDCIIGQYSHIAPSSTICGNVIIGEKTLVGANATVLPGLSIGDNVIIGAGSVVTKNIPSNTIVAGNPARKL